MPPKDYASLGGGIDVLLGKKFMLPGGRSFMVGSEENTASVLMNNSEPVAEDFGFCKAYGAALRAALKKEGLQEDGFSDSNYWTYSGDVETVRRLAVQATAAAGMTLDPDFVARLSTMTVNQLVHMVGIQFRVEA